MKDIAIGAGFEALRKQAKRWLKALRAGDQVARARLDKVLPKHLESPVLREVQQALAREQGFDSWAALKEHHQIAVVETACDEALLAEFLERACIFSGPVLDFPHKWHRAERIRVRHPRIAQASIHAAIVCGDRDEVERRLRADPGASTEKGGPQGWEPLLFVCYNRLPHPPAADESMAIAKLLLDSGADPNSHFWLSGAGWKLRFNALTGAMGQGEMGQPEHPRAEELARLLLERGADANDSQGLYNTHLTGDETKWLRLLFSYGLGKDDFANWDEKPDPASRILNYLVAQAAKNGHIQRLSCLLERGADPNARSHYNDKSCYQSALLAGKLEVAELLARHGARREPLEGQDAFVGACMRVDRDEATRLLNGHPEYLESVDPLIDAAANGDAPVVTLLLELGMDPNRVGKHGHRALNVASKNAVISQLLLDHGANPRERCFGGTPANWARLDKNFEMARFFASKSRYILDAVGSGHVALARELIAENPRCIDERSPSGNTPLHDLPDDPELAQELIDLLIQGGADPAVKNDAGQTPAAKLEIDGLDEIADLLEAATS